MSVASTEPVTLWTYNDVVAYTTYCRRVVQAAVADGKLKWTGSSRKKLFRKADVDRWLESLAGETKVEPPAPKPKARPYKPVFIKG
jgi:hypothetical protein